MSKEILSEAANITERAEEIGFIGESGGRYTIVPKHRSASGLASDLKKRWLVFSLKKKRYQFVQNAVKELQEKFRRQRAQLLQQG